MQVEDSVIHHYERPGLAASILRAAGKERPAAADLAPYDEFHIGGRRATEYLAAALGAADGMALLDIGCGIGGAARYIAETTGAHVTGLDLTPGYIEAAASLSEACGLSGRTRFATGSALAMPFANESFDAGFTIHAAMNIADKAALYKEARRVLKRGGTFVLYDVLGDAATLTYPMPWAEEPSFSFLVTPETLLPLLAASGFEILEAEDRSAFARESLGRLISSGAWPVLVMGEGAHAKVTHLYAAIGQGLCAPWQIVCRAL